MNPYEVLELKENASAEDIKKAYRKLAKQYHPDTNSGDKQAENKFKEISSAYEILSDPQKREHFDQFGDVKDSNFGAQSYGFNMGNLSNMFRGGIFGNNMQDFVSRQALIEPDIKIAINISLKDVICGIKKHINYKKYICCNKCCGQRYQKTNKKCKTCGGNGVLGSSFQNVTFTRTCHACGGVGHEVLKCPDCNGVGFSTEDQKININIPAGIPPNSILRIDRGGNDVYVKVTAAYKHPNTKITGNLYVAVQFEKEQNGILIDGKNIYATVRVPFNTILAENQITVNVLECKKIEFKLNSERESGHIYRVDGAGIDGHAAFVEVFIDRPENIITGVQRSELNEHMEKIYGKPVITFCPSSINSA